ncbi:MAG: efflux RND transporter permease subunit, partial [Candidatus Thermoplasmatota archaeon]|nr:efflux RND transporter permease subunit [Candidatus Thermoplasmatota archaeon]
NRTAIEDSHRIISPMAYDFQGEHVYMSPLAFTVIFDAINESAQGTLSFLFPMAIIFIIVVLLVNYRSVSETVLSLLALMMAIIWVFGIAVLLGYQFNVILIAVPILIIGLGIDYAIHLVMRYKEELKKGKGIRESAAVSIHMVGGALFLTTITTMIGFLSNTTSTILPIRDFGFLSALGILCSLIVMITFVPAIKIVFDERREKKGKNIKALHKSDNGNSVMGSAKEKGEKALSSILGGSAAAAEHHPYKVLAIVVIVSLIGAYGASQLTTEFDIMDFLPEDVEESNTIRYMMDNFEFSESYVYIYVKGDMTDPQVLLAMEETSLNTIDSPGTAGEQPMSPVQVICQIAQTSPLDRDYNLTLVMAIEDRDETGNCLPDSDVAGLYDLIREDGTHWTSLSRVLYYNEETGEYDKALLRVRETTRSDGEVEALKDALGKDAAPFKSMESVTHVSVVGDSIVGKDTLDAINENQIFSLILTIIASTIVLTLILGFLDRSALLGGVTIVPILLVIIWMWGSMQFMGYSLNVMTNMIAALSIGLGLDYAIHITHRFREELDKTGDPDKACREAVTKTGAGITGAAVTTMGAFAILGFSTLVPMQIFGQITALAVLYGYLSSVFVLPTILVLWAKSRQKRVQRKNGLAEEKSKESKKSVNDGAEEAPAHI